MIVGVWFLRPSRQSASRLPTGASSCRPMTTAMSFRCRQTRYPRSTSTASEPCRTRGGNGAVRRLDSEKLRAVAGETPLREGRQAFRDPPVRAWEKPHELTSRSSARKRLRTWLRKCLWPNYP